MLKNELLRIDIEETLNLIGKALNEGGDRVLVDPVRNKYRKIAKQVECDNDLISSLIELEHYEDDGGSYEFYTALSCSLEQLKRKITACEKYEEIRFTKPVFANIKSRIIELIDLAQYSIWVAVAWIGDKDIYQALINATTREVDVRVATLATKNCFKVLNKEGTIECRYFPEYEYGKKNLHHKFCVFDFTTVTSGSYNWTNNATTSEEDMIITRDEKCAAMFCTRFLDLYGKGSSL